MQAKFKTEKEVWWEPVGLHSNPSYYPGLDAQPKTAALAKNLWNRDLPVGFHLELARVFHKGASSVQAYDHLWHHYREADDEALREEVNKFYRLAYNSVTALIVQEARKKDAAYWAATAVLFVIAREPELPGPPRSSSCIRRKAARCSNFCLPT